MTIADRVARLMRLLEPERAHRLAVRTAPYGRFRVPAVSRDRRLSVNVLGLDFGNPIGLAAGFDKNAAIPDAMFGLGFGFVEVGTVTPLPQAGNPRPRMFRLPEDRALINRLGFNNEGHEAALEHLDGRRNRNGVLGINIGANRDSEDRVQDYVAGVRLFAPEADYLTINISSPNTPGLRDLQGRAALADLLARSAEARQAAAEECERRPPLLLKLAPDLSEAALADVIDLAREQGVDGLIIGNTTVSRPRLRTRRNAGEVGGLSGPPLFDLSTAMLARARQLAGDSLALVGVGGVDGAAAAWSKIAAGADLVQLYTALAYQGPSLPRRICAGLLKRLEERGIGSIGDVRGIETQRWAATWNGQG